MNPLISVIIPAYNAEKHIEKCLESIKNQSLKNFEAIIVNPGSIDQTGELVQRVSAKDCRFISIHCNRMFSGAARNEGLRHAKGQFIAFCDADDIMEPNMLEIMANKLEETNGDIAVCDFNMVYTDKTISRFSKLIDKTIMLTSKNYADYYYKYSAAPKPNNYVWSRMYRRDFIERTGYILPDTPVSEDHLFNIMLYTESPVIVHIGEPLYNYVQHDQSILRILLREKDHGALYRNVFQLTMDFFKKQQYPYSEAVLAIYAYTRVKSILFYAWQAGIDDADIHQALNSFFALPDISQYLSICVRNQYIDRYREIHNLSTQWETAVKDMLHACITKEPIPNMELIFK